MKSVPTVRHICQEMLRSGLTIRLQVTGKSMHPTIQSGDWITVNPVKSLEFRSGEILLYAGEKGLVAHRLIGLDGDLQLRLQGDACRYVETVQVSQILGRVVIAESESGLTHLASSAARFRYLLLSWNKQLSAFFRTTIHPALRRV